MRSYKRQPFDSGGLEFTMAVTDDQAPNPGRAPVQVSLGRGLSSDPQDVEDGKVRLKEAGEKRIGHEEACQLRAAASCLLL